MLQPPWLASGDCLDATGTSSPSLLRPPKAKDAHGDLLGLLHSSHLPRLCLCPLRCSHLWINLLGHEGIQRVLIIVLQHSKVASLRADKWAVNARLWQLADRLSSGLSCDVAHIPQGASMTWPKPGICFKIQHL